MLKYNFLIFSLIFAMPGILVYFLRQDLRHMMHILALCSIPFAFTEFFFYPSYWEPIFLFDLVRTIGFGIEDVLFVIGLSAFTSTIYPVLFGKKLIAVKRKNSSPTLRLANILIVCIILICLISLIGVHMIFGAPLIMISISLLICILRNDLILPGILGGFLSTIVYGLLCYILLLIYPDVFNLTWHTDKFINFPILSIPIEEIIYAFSSGMIATLFYPFVFAHRFV